MKTGAARSLLALAAAIVLGPAAAAQTDDDPIGAILNAETPETAPPVAAATAPSPPPEGPVVAPEALPAAPPPALAAVPTPPDVPAPPAPQTPPEVAPAPTASAPPPPAPAPAPQPPAVANAPPPEAAHALPPAVAPTPPMATAPASAPTPPAVSAIPPPAAQPVAPAPAPTASAPAPSPTARPYAPAPAAYPRPPPAPAATLPYRSRSRPIGQPVHIDELHKTPEAPPNDSEIGYESRLRSSFASAQGLQGPLDGGWVMSVDGADRYGLELAERSSGQLEGAWRDLRREGALDGSGFIETLRRDGGQLTLSFRVKGGQYASAILIGGLDGRWTGELVDGPRRAKVTMRRK